MINKKRIVSAVMASMLMFVNVGGFSKNVDAKPVASIYVDGKALIAPVEPQIVSDRLFVPYAALGEALSASVYWDDSQKKVTMVLNDKYSIVYIGNSTMTYGKLSTDSKGSLVYETTNTRALDAAPFIVNSRTLIPLSALSEGLGANVMWDGNTRTAYVSSPPKSTPSATPTPSPTATPTATPNPTEDTSYFKMISGTRAQSMYENREQFVLVYFDSTRIYTAQYLQMIKEAAKDAQIKIYGVDASLSTSTAINPKFAASYLTSVTSLAYPALFYVHGLNNIKTNLSPTNKTQVAIDFDDFVYNTIRNTTPPINLSKYLQEITSVSASNKYLQGTEKFVLVYYDSENADSMYYMDNVIKDATYNAGYTVYMIDASSKITTDGKLLKDEPSFWANNATRFYPTVFFVDKGKYNVTGYPLQAQPTDTKDLTRTIINFMTGR